jgi:myo-inositol 2-dehydrogenase / D-chiro-inositol 1-dehydrogenase
MTDRAPLCRRGFLKTAAAAAPAVLLAPAILEGRDVGGQLQVGFIGVGGRGRTVLGKINNNVSTSNARVAAICDIDEAHRTWGIEHCPNPRPDGIDDYRKLLDRKDIDAVFIATPVYLHSEMAAAACAAGKHIYCEKPLGRTPEEAQRVYHAVKAAKGIKFQVGFQWRYQEVWQRSVELVQKGEIGKVLFVKAQRHGPLDLPRDTAWYFKRDLSGDIIVEQAVHEMNIFCWLLGAHAVRAAGFGGINRYVDAPPGRTVMDHYTLSLEFPGNVRLSYSHCFFAPGPFGGLYQHVYGEEGGIDLVDGVIHKDGKSTRLEVDRVDATETAVREFFRAVHEDREVLADVEAGYRATMTAILGRTALHSGRTVAWEEIEGAPAK